MSALDQLRALNPWTQSVWADCSALLAASQSRLAAAQFDPSARLRLHEARREAALARMARGTPYWNQWALAMLDLVASQSVAKQETPLWHALARADFKDTHWPRGLDVAGMVFPGAAGWAGARIDGDTWCQAAQFLGPCDFSAARIAGEASWDNARLRDGLMADDLRADGAVSLRSAKVMGGLTLNGAQFSEPFWARGVTFQGFDARDATFKADAGFGGCRFRGPAQFAKTRFEGLAGFEDATFEAAADFSGSRFGGAAWFERAQFRGPANFDVARFAGAIRFDGVGVAENEPEVRAQIDRIRRAYGG